MLNYAFCQSMHTHVYMKYGDSTSNGIEKTYLKIKIVQYSFLVIISIKQNDVQLKRWYHSFSADLELSHWQAGYLLSSIANSCFYTYIVTICVKSAEMFLFLCWDVIGIGLWGGNLRLSVVLSLLYLHSDIFTAFRPRIQENNYLITSK